MPMTPWTDIVGYVCISCHQWATHWYGSDPLCCRCHCGDNNIDSEDDYMQSEAIKMNTLFQKGLPLTEDDMTEDIAERWALDTLYTYPPEHSHE